VSLLDEIAGRLAAAGARRHAGWDAGLFRALIDGPAARLGAAVGSRPSAGRVLEAYARLLVEAVGLGYIDRPGLSFLSGEVAQMPASLTYLAVLLVRVVPPSFAEGEPAVKRGVREQLDQIASMWNIGEGLLAQSAWLNRYLCAASGQVARMDDVEPALERALGPALSAPPPAAFEGPFSTIVLDASALDPAFLPGNMHLAAPAVLCVHDRRRPDLHAAVLLGQGGGSSFLGLFPCLGQGPHERGTPEVELLEGGARVGRHEVALPTLNAVHRAAIARAGFLVVAAVDSQRLWVVESP
jgi:hypothetical protein